LFALRCRKRPEILKLHEAKCKKTRSTAAKKAGKSNLQAKRVFSWYEKNKNRSFIDLADISKFQMTAHYPLHQQMNCRSIRIMKFLEAKEDGSDLESTHD
jgi:hypothetical protein